MEDYRLIEIEEDIEDDFEDEDDDEEDYDDEEYEEELIPEVIMSPRGSNFIFNAGEEDEDEDDDDEEEDEEDDDDEEDYEVGEEGEELIPLAMLLPRGPISFSHPGEQADDDYEDEDDYEEEDYEEEEEEDEEEEGEELFPVEITSPRVSSSIVDGRTSQGEVVINGGLLDNSNDLESSEGKSENQVNGGEDGGEGELNRGEIDGLFCPICFEAWTSGGEHQICCLPCGHIYGLSCIKKWLQRCRNSGKCPQCNSLCTFKDVRILYATRLCVADAELHKRVRALEAKCAYLEQKVASQAAPPTPEELINQICNNSTLVQRLATALAELNQRQGFL